MKITLRQLKAFHTIAEVGSFTRAAQRLQIAQPAMSLAMRELERELDVRLLDRTTRRVELTGAGREFLLATEKIIDDLEHSIRSARDLTYRKRGRLVVAAPPLLAAMIVPPVFAAYKETNPGIELHLVDTQTDDIVVRVRSGAADCGIGTFAEDEEGIRREVLLKDSLMLWCRSGTPLAEKKAITWSELRFASLIMLTHASNIRAIVDRACENAGHAPQPAYEVSQMTTAIMLVEAGLGVAPLPTYVGSFAYRRKVTGRPLIEPQVRREISFVQSSNRSLSPAAEEFLRLLRKHARASRWAP